MNNHSLKDCPLRTGLLFRLAALLLTGLAAVILSSNASAQSETRIISVATNLNFGKVEIDGARDAVLSIANDGNADLTISNVNLPDGFSMWLGFGEGVTNITIPAGGQTNIIVIFAPTNVMNYGGTATVDSDATSGNNEFTLSGGGAFPTPAQYIGLFFPATNAAFENSGSFSAKLEANGAFSGVLRLAGVRSPFSGRLTSVGSFSGSIPLKGGSALGVSFQIYPGLLQGVISNDTWSADLLAYAEFPALEAVRVFQMPILPQSRRRQVETAPRKYHFQIAGSTDPLLGPTNNGVGTIEFRTAQSVRLRGTLGDGTVFSQDTSMLGGYRLPLYAPLYRNRGAVLGWIDYEVVPTNLFPISGIMPVTNIVLNSNGTGIDYFTNVFAITNFPFTNIVPITNIIITNFPPFTNFPPITNIVFTNFPPFTNFPSFTNFPPITNVPPLLPPGGIIIGLRDEPRGNAPSPGLPTIPGTNRISGSINWFKPAQIDPNYPDGFSLETTVSGPTD